MSQLRNKTGLTLVELVMVIVIVGILTSVSSMYIKQVIDLWSFLTFRNEVVAQGRLALTRMGREVRQVKDNSSISIADASRLEFTDVNDNVIDYRLFGGNLMRNSNILAKGVSGLIFCYYDIYNNPVCAPECGCDVSSGELSDIYRIKIKFDVASGGQSKHLEMQSFPRNITN